jgi:molybdopterin-guanine dinucleotide biosynthesis protein A
MKPTETKIKGLVLTGGYSRRMGKDKADLVFHTEAQYKHLFTLLSRFCKEVYISCRQAQTERFNEVPLIIDKYPWQSPLNGIISALSTQPEKAWLVVACDMPFVGADTIEYLLSNRDTEKIATVFQSPSDNLPEPLCAIWESAALAIIQENIKQNILSPRRILVNSDCQLLTASNPLWLKNVNIRAEFEEAKDL